jgi:hypothetical protein
MEIGTMDKRINKLLYLWVLISYTFSAWFVSVFAVIFLSAAGFISTENAQLYVDYVPKLFGIAE